MKAIILSLADLERSVICRKTERRFLIKADEHLLFCSLQKTMSGGRITDELLQNSRPVYVGLPLNVDKKILKHCQREFSWSGTVYFGAGKNVEAGKGRSAENDNFPRG